MLAAPIFLEMSKRGQLGCDEDRLGHFGHVPAAWADGTLGGSENFPP